MNHFTTPGFWDRYNHLSAEVRELADRNFELLRQNPQHVARQLGALAMRFRGTRDETARRAIATEYAQEVQRLIETGNWSEAPAFEDMLPDEWMPETFFDYWCPDAAP